MNCGTCANWQLKTSTLARHSMAPCSLSVPYTALPQRSTCDRHKPLEQAAADTRAAWLAKIEQKHMNGAMK